MITDLFNLAGMIHIDERTGVNDALNPKKLLSAYSNTDSSTSS